MNRDSPGEEDFREGEEEDEEVTVVLKSAAPAKVPCRSCGHQINPQARFCSSCGAAQPIA
jgi:uncharacterized OB-fold protein